MDKDANEVVKAVGDYALITFYDLLRLGEYKVKRQRNDTKQMVQFKLEDAIFFRRYAKGCLRQLPTNALDEDVLSAEGATLKPDNQKMDETECVFIKNTTEPSEGIGQAVYFNPPKYEQ